MNKTCLLLSESSLLHDTGYGHPERIERYQAIQKKLSTQSYFSELTQPKIKPITDEISLAHSKEHVKKLFGIQNKSGSLDPDTRYSPSTFQAIKDSIGGAISIADEILNNRAKNGLLVARPPGHHAEEDTAMGFCFANTVSILARYLQTKGIEKIFIFDFDVHHGNGTEQIFYEDNNVFFSSIHQYPFYPGTGSEKDTGAGKGLGYTRNIPLQRGSGKSEYLSSIEKILIPEIDKFKPEFILISAGFDAHRNDPLGGMELTSNDYEKITQIVQRKADEICGGKIISVLEGGYDLEALSESVEAHLATLVG
ncbi:MAG: histone deacetylase [Leptospiraceae bacterium]|nr:histone deacetylase [Leptospiraceae bacterium]